VTCASFGRSQPRATDRSDALCGGAIGVRPVVSTASPRASARTPIRAGTSLSSIGVDATHRPSRQWLTTIFRCSECLVTLSDAPRPRASGMVSRFGSIHRLWTDAESVSRGGGASLPRGRRHPGVLPQHVGVRPHPDAVLPDTEGHRGRTSICVDGLAPVLGLGDQSTRRDVHRPPERCPHTSDPILVTHT